VLDINTLVHNLIFIYQHFRGFQMTITADSSAL